MEFVEGQSRFEAIEDGRVIGWVTNDVNQDGVHALRHTISLEEGRGVASGLVEFVLNLAEERRWQILPYCPFIESYIQDHPQYAELIPSARRREFGL
ncbi:MAG: N-acetyltransferase [Propionibacteriaceae bacterium]|jgi:predicted GNAT family acetyltransferase|nr:N-acetyltransferase [Propionibacteriaceae bacterium]